MTKRPPLKSLNNSMNDLAERFWSKNSPFVQPERHSERCAKIEVNSLKYNIYRLNAAAEQRLVFGASVRSER